MDVQLNVKGFVKDVYKAPDGSMNIAVAANDKGSNEITISSGGAVNKGTSGTLVDTFVTGQMPDGLPEHLKLH